MKGEDRDAVLPGRPCDDLPRHAFDILHDLEGVGAVLVTDPPYSSGGAYRGDRAMATTTKDVIL